MNLLLTSFLFLSFSFYIFCGDLLPVDDDFNSAQEEINQAQFMQELMSSPWVCYQQLQKQYECNRNFPFPATGFALAQVEATLAKIVSTSENLAASRILTHLFKVKLQGLPYQSTKELITEALFFLQNYYASTNQLVSNNDVMNKYNKTQNYDKILGEFQEDRFNEGFEFFYLTGEVPIEFFNRTWHLPFSPLEASTRPINLFDFSVGGPRCVISHDLVHHRGKAISLNIEDVEKLIQKLNAIVDNYRNSSGSSENIVNAIELIRFWSHHEKYYPSFSVDELRYSLMDPNHVIATIGKRVRAGEFGAKYNVASLEIDLRVAIEILIRELSADA